jgi:hypothetical protein
MGGGLYHDKRLFEWLYMVGFSPRYSSLGLSFSIIPYWMLVPFALALSTASWLHWQYSLRTLLIITTLIAATLGIIVWAVRAG